MNTKELPLSVCVCLYSSPWQVIWASNAERQVINGLLIWTCLEPLDYQKVLEWVSEETGSVSKAYPSGVRDVCNEWSSGSRKIILLRGSSCDSELVTWSERISWAVVLSILSHWFRIDFLSERVMLPCCSSQMHPANFHAVKGTGVGMKQLGEDDYPRSGRREMLNPH